MSPKRIALFGGTFDPIHLGHIQVAQDAAQRLHVEQVVLIPAKRSPLKANTPRASDDERLHMLRLAIADTPSFSLSTCDLDRPAPSYTRDTVRIFRERFDHHGPLFWLIGADAVSELSVWYKVRELIEDCTLATMRRAHAPEPDFSSLANVTNAAGLQNLRDHVLPTPAIAISSSEIRRRLASGDSVEKTLHPAVYAYIQSQGLYGTGGDS